MTGGPPPPPSINNSRPAAPSSAPNSTAQRPDSSRLILASGSPRRSDLLRAAGYVFTIHISNVDESEHPPSLSAEQLARHLAERKARAVAGQFPDAIALGADTVVSAANRILGKPVDRDDARRILSLLSGTTHTVITAVALIRLDPPFAKITAVHSTVAMRALSPAELEAYLATDQWQGKAGAYGIQDNDPFVTAITGCPTNIVGLPITTTKSLLAQAGIHPTRSAPLPPA